MMNKYMFLIPLMLLTVNWQLMVCQNQDINIEEDRQLIELRNDVYRAIRAGYKPNPTEEEKKYWKNKQRRPECGGNWIANLPDFYATEDEVLSIVVVSGFFGALPSVDSSKVDYDSENKVFRVTSYLDFFTGCDSCNSEKEEDNIYTGKLPAGDYTVFYERTCNSKKELRMYQDTLSFKIHPSDSEEEVAKMKEQKILEQIPENLPPIIDGGKKEEIRFQYTLTKAEKISVEIYNTSGTKRYLLMAPTVHTKLGYNEFYLSIPEELISPDELRIGEYFKISINIGDREYESLNVYYW